MASLIDELCQAADDMISVGLKPLPLRDKQPRVRDWPDKAFSVRQIREWLLRWQDKFPEEELGIGVQLGPSSGIIDFEYDTLEQLERIYQLFGGKENMPDGPQFTSRHGGHFLFKFEPWMADINTANLYAPILDASGNPLPIKDHSPLIVRVGTGPDPGTQSAFPPTANRIWAEGWDIEMLDCLGAPCVTELAKQNMLTLRQIIPSSQGRNSAKVQLLDDSLAVESAIDAMRLATKNMEDSGDGSKRKKVCMHRCYDESLTDEAAVTAFRRYEVERPFNRDYTDAQLIAELRRLDSKGVKREPSLPILSDAYNATRLARLCHDIRYVCSWKKWIVWDGSRWRTDDTGAINRLAIETVHAMQHEASQLANETERELLLKHAIRSQSKRSLDSMTSLVKSIKPVPVSHELLNQNGWLLNCANGMIDLRTGSLCKHRREDLITQLAPYDFAMSNEPPQLWLKFLDRIFASNAAMIGFVQRLIGYSLIGETTEHILPIFWGGGANGKSTLTNTVVTALGDYAKVVSTDFVMLTKWPKGDTELMGLYQTRFVVNPETEENGRLNEAQVKCQTGGERITGRRLYENPWSFIPSHTLFVQSNHKPRISGTDHGIWRRVKLVPFVVQIPDEEKDLDLAEKLKAEIPQILRWLVAGCLAWQREGLNPPPEVIEATERYREDSDIVGEFLEECCVEGTDREVRTMDLYDAYVRWAKSCGYMPHSQKRFDERIKTKYEKCVNSKRHKIYRGLAIRIEDGFEEVF